MITLNGTPFYATQADLLSKWGQDTITQWSDLDGTGVLDAPRVNTSLLWADAQINAQFAAGGIFTLPNGGYLALGPVSQILTNQWACIIAGTYLYEVRSGRDEKYNNNLLPQLAEVKKQMHLAASDTKNGMGFDARRSWPVSNAPLGYAPSNYAWSPISPTSPASGGRIISG